MNSSVDKDFNCAKKWQKEVSLLRTVLLECELEETLKWGKPCYSYNSQNIVIIQAFKEHCDIGFFNGALLKDKNKLLVKAGTHTQNARQFRFTDYKEISSLSSALIHKKKLSRYSVWLVYFGYP